MVGYFSHFRFGLQDHLFAEAAFNQVRVKPTLRWGGMDEWLVKEVLEWGRKTEGSRGAGQAKGDLRSDPVGIPQE